MQYRILPADGTKISEIGLGLGIVTPQDDVRALLNGALERQINYFDLCGAYDCVYPAVKDTLARRRAEVVTQMHLGAVYRDGAYAFTRSFTKARAAFLQNLDLTGLGYTDFLMIHCIDTDQDFDRVIKEGERSFIGFAEDCIRQGLARHLGFSTHNPAVAQRFLASGRFDLFMFSINAAFDFTPDGELALGQSSERMALYQKAQARGVGICVMKPFAGRQLLNAQSSPLGTALSVTQCLQYVLDRPAVLTAVAGASKPEQLEDYLRLYAPGEDLDYGAVLAHCTKANNLQRCLYCNHCSPCPQHLNVGLINKYYDLARLGDPLAREHYQQLDFHASDCSHCGHCDERCPFHCPQMQRLDEIAAYFGK